LTAAVIAILGPTASGKTALALEAALALAAEIVSADSRLIYRGMDVATAKPSLAERARVPHHLIDVAEPGERYDASRYQRDGRAALAAIARRGRVALVVGGTGLYVRALLDGLTLAALPHDETVRAEIEALAASEGGEALHRRLTAVDPAAAASVDARNVRRVARYLEVATLTGSWSARAGHEEQIPAVRIGLRPPRDALDRAIDQRARRMVDDGVLEETRRLLETGIDERLPSWTAHGYVHWAAHLRGAIDLDTAVARTARDVRAYSRRQMTWFRRDARIRWVDPSTEDALACLRGRAASRIMDA